MNTEKRLLLILCLMFAVLFLRCSMGIAINEAIGNIQDKLSYGYQLVAEFTLFCGFLLCVIWFVYTND